MLQPEVLLNIWSLAVVAAVPEELVQVAVAEVPVVIVRPLLVNPAVVGLLLNPVLPWLPKPTPLLWVLVVQVVPEESVQLEKIPLLPELFPSGEDLGILSPMHLMVTALAGEVVVASTMEDQALQVRDTTAAEMLPETGPPAEAEVQVELDRILSDPVVLPRVVQVV
jgi:hypothetical protein